MGIDGDKKTAKVTL